MARLRLTRYRRTIRLGVPSTQIVHHRPHIAVELFGVFFTDTSNFREDWIKGHGHPP